MGIRFSQSEDIDVKYVNYYDVMGVDPSATDAEIKQQYQELSKSYHPDKQGIGRTPALHDSNYSALSTSSDTQATLNEAWKTLGDEISRALYNAATGYAGPKEKEFERYHALKVKQSQDRVKEYQIEYYRKHAAWIEEYKSLARSGYSGLQAKPKHFPKLFILQALYGDVVRAEARALPTKPGKTLDVTMILRKLSHPDILEVHTPKSYFHLPDSFSYIDGFYDPNYDNSDYNGPTVLYIRYIYDNNLYEAYLPDGQEILTLPNEDHYVEEDERCQYYDRYDDHCYPQHLFNEVEESLGALIATDQPNMSNSLVSLINHYASPHEDSVPTFPTTQALIESAALSDPQDSYAAEESPTSKSHKKTSALYDITSPHSALHASAISTLDPDLASSTVIQPVRDPLILSSIPPHLANEQLYSTNGVPLPRWVWEQKMKPVKAKRRRTLYFVLSLLATSIFSFLQWGGVIDVFSWPGAVKTRSVQMLEYIKKNNGANDGQDV